MSCAYDLAKYQRKLENLEGDHTLFDIPPTLKWDPDYRAKRLIAVALESTPARFHDRSILVVHFEHGWVRNDKLIIDTYSYHYMTAVGTTLFRIDWQGGEHDPHINDNSGRHLDPRELGLEATALNALIVVRWCIQYGRTQESPCVPRHAWEYQDILDRARRELR